MMMQIIDVENPEQNHVPPIEVTQVPKAGDKVRYILCYNHETWHVLCYNRETWENGNKIIEGTVVSVEWTYTYNSEFAEIRVSP